MSGLTSRKSTSSKALHSKRLLETDPFLELFFLRIYNYAKTSLCKDVRHICRYRAILFHFSSFFNYYVQLNCRDPKAYKGGQVRNLFCCHTLIFMRLKNKKQLFPIKPSQMPVGICRDSNTVWITLFVEASEGRYFCATTTKKYIRPFRLITPVPR